jgi:hypothetical protein
MEINTEQLIRENKYSVNWVVIMRSPTSIQVRMTPKSTSFTLKLSNVLI